MFYNIHVNVSTIFHIIFALLDTHGDAKIILSHNPKHETYKAKRRNHTPFFEIDETTEMTNCLSGLLVTIHYLRMSGKDSTLQCMSSADRPVAMMGYIALRSKHI